MSFILFFLDETVDCERVGDERFHATVACDTVAKRNHE
jgi:hypothetical protein